MSNSITWSYGNDLQVETVSLSVLAWLNINTTQYKQQIQAGVMFLLKQIESDAQFGSTQATVLAIQALVRYTHFFGWNNGFGKFKLYLNNEMVNELEFSETSRPISKVDWSDSFTNTLEQAKGTSKVVKLAIEDYKYNNNGQGFQFSFLLQANFMNSVKPISRNDAGLKFTITYDVEMEDMEVGDNQTQSIILENVSGKPQGMAIAVLGIPSCLTYDQVLLNSMFDHVEFNPG